MQYLCKLITPPNGIILDPFAGSGTTGEAAIIEGFFPILIELESDYIKIIKNRLNLPKQKIILNNNAIFDIENEENNEQ